MDKRTLALGEQCVGEVVERAPTTVAPVAFDPWPVVVIAPGTDGVTLATGTLEQVICPPKRMAIGMAGVDVEACVEMGEHRHDGQSPLVTRSTLEQIGRFSLLITLYLSANCDKLSDSILGHQLHCAYSGRRLPLIPVETCHPSSGGLEQ
jgi:hypothetical protein